MHYVRFLKTPSVTPLGNSFQLASRITITTDLGEAFLCCDLEVVAILLEEDGTFSKQNCIVLQWKAGMRQLDVSWLVTKSARGSASKTQWPCRLFVGARPSNKSPAIFTDFLQRPAASNELAGGVVRLESEPFFSHPIPSERRVKRCFGLDSQDTLVIWEETGESIARHVWDAGLLLSAYLYALRNDTSKTRPPPLPLLLRILGRKRPRILELGAGCGIVGITLAACYESAEVILTDLPEAEEIAKFNISQNVLLEHNQPRQMTVAYQNLDWSEPLDDCFKSAPFDLLVAADVTYNSDVVPDLVKVIAEMINVHNNDALALIAMKVRHDSEMIFFDLMKKEKLVIKDRISLPLPMLAEEDQAIKIYLFGGTSSDEAV